MNPIEVAKIITEIVNMCDDRKDKIMCKYCAQHRLCEHLDKELDKATKE